MLVVIVFKGDALVTIETIDTPGAVGPGTQVTQPSLKLGRFVA
jgi:hypothetical protein